MYSQISPANLPIASGENGAAAVEYAGMVAAAMAIVYLAIKFFGDRLASAIAVIGQLLELV